jgi:hypothetical protein
MAEPRLERVSGGWAARYDRLVVYGTTREEALRRFAVAERQRQKYPAQPQSAPTEERAPDDEAEA